LLNSKFVTERQGLYPTRLFETKVSKTTKTKKIVDIVVINEPKVAIAFQAE
jgi:hypothetical protein